MGYFLGVHTCRGGCGVLQNYHNSLNTYLKIILFLAILMEKYRYVNINSKYVLSNTRQNCIAVSMNVHRPLVGNRSSQSHKVKNTHIMEN